MHVFLHYVASLFLLKMLSWSWSWSWSWKLDFTFDHCNGDHHEDKYDVDLDQVRGASLIWILPWRLPLGHRHCCLPGKTVQNMMVMVMMTTIIASLCFHFVHFLLFDHFSSAICLTISPLTNSHFHYIPIKLSLSSYQRWREGPTRGVKEKVSGTLSPLSRGTLMTDHQERSKTVNCVAMFCIAWFCIACQ